MDILPDLLDYKLDIVFCGTAVGNKSAEMKAYYAGYGNSFYKTLHEIGLTDKQIKPTNYKELLDYKIGLTDLVKKVSGNDNQLKKDDFDIESFRAKIEKYQPKIICFNGKDAAKTFLQEKTVFYGIQNCKIQNTEIYLAPSTSGSARGFWNIKYWEDLKTILK